MLWVWIFRRKSENLNIIIKVSLAYDVSFDINYVSFVWLVLFNQFIHYFSYSGVGVGLIIGNVNLFAFI